MSHKINITSPSGQLSTDVSFSKSEGGTVVYIDIGTQRIEVGLSNVGNIYVSGLGVYGYTKEFPTDYSYRAINPSCEECGGLGYTEGLFNTQALDHECKKIHQRCASCDDFFIQNIWRKN